MAVDVGLVLIGMGPGGIESMTIAAIQAALDCDILLYESYTALWSDEDFNTLSSIVGEITTVMRPDIERPDWILEQAKTKRVGVLIVGDPLQATTHTDLRLRALDGGVKCEVVHGISITGLVTGAIGLSNYRFGRQTTLTYPYNGWVATSPLEVIAENLYRGMHTLALLDLDPTGAGEGEQRPMTPQDAHNSLVLMFEKLNAENIERNNALDECKSAAILEFNEVILENVPVVLCSDMGTHDQMIIFTSIAGLNDCEGGRLNCLVFPAKPSEIESLALETWSKE